MNGSASKVALMTGVTGQDGAYLAELLLAKGYGSTASSAGRPHSTPSASTIFTRIRTSRTCAFHMHYGDMTDATNLIRIMQETQPDEIYNLAAQSHVQVSFETPEYTANADGLGTLRLLEAIRILGLEKQTRFYQASTSEMYGLVQETAAGNHAVPPAFALRRGQTLRLLDHGELSRGLRHARLERHLVQS